MENLYNLLQLKITKKSDKLLTEALTHRSMVRNSKLKKHNERLEFLGDAVLELIVTEFLFKEFPDEQEGFLTSIRSALVNKTHLACVAHRLNLNTVLIISQSEKKSGGLKNDYLLANAVESILGAVYLAYGITEVSRIIHKFVLVDTQTIIETKAHRDPKSELQERTQCPEKGFKTTPEYKVVKEAGKDHNKVFFVEVYVQSKKIGEGSGKSKKCAELAAAKEALGSDDFGFLCDE